MTWMTRRRRSASASDVREFRSGRASSSDKREMGFRKVAGRLRAGPRTPKAIRAAEKRGHKGGKARRFMRGAKR